MNNDMPRVHSGHSMKLSKTLFRIKIYTLKMGLDIYKKEALPERSSRSRIYGLKKLSYTGV